MKKQYMSVAYPLKKKVRKSLPKMDKEINKIVEDGWTLENSQLDNETRNMILIFSKEA